MVIKNLISGLKLRIELTESIKSSKK